MASICDVAHPILADVNLGLLQIHNNLVLMQLWYIDPVVVFEKVTKIVYRRIEKPISVDGVYFGLQCLPPTLFYQEPVSITEQGIVLPLHMATLTRRARSKRQPIGRQIELEIPSHADHPKREQ